MFLTYFFKSYRRKTFWGGRLDRTGRVYNIVLDELFSSQVPISVASKIWISLCKISRTGQYLGHLKGIRSNFVHGHSMNQIIVPQLSKCLTSEAVWGVLTDQMIWIWTKRYNKTHACIVVHRMARYNHLIDWYYLLSSVKLMVIQSVESFT